MGNGTAWKACGCFGCWPDVESARRETLLSSLLRGCIREKMENVREPRGTGCPDLTCTAFYWRSEGGELDMCECFGFVVMYGAAAGCEANIN